MSADNIKTKDSRIVSMGKDVNGSIIIDINTRVLLDENIAAKLRIDGALNKSNNDYGNANGLEADQKSVSSMKMEYGELSTGDKLTSNAGKKEVHSTDNPVGSIVGKGYRECTTHPASTDNGALRKADENTSKIENFIADHPTETIWFAISIFIANIVILMLCFCGGATLGPLPWIQFSMPPLCSLPVIGILCCMARCVSN